MFDYKKTIQKAKEKYPQVFAENFEEYRNHAGQGWEKLILGACHEIAKYNELNKSEIKICQIKEKFGGLRIYIKPGVPILLNILALIEKQSFKVCENCSADGTLKKRGGYVITLCDPCFEEGKDQ